MANILKFPGPTFAKATQAGASTCDEAQEVTTHGGDLDVARQKWPDAPTPWIDLSTGINPFSYPLPKLSPDVWARLPIKSKLEDLCCAAAQRYSVADSAMVVAAPGTQALIQTIPRLFESKSVAVVGPTYSEHAECWHGAGHDVSIVTSLKEAADADVVVVVNPNNPTGRVISAQSLLALGGALAARNGLLIVDEAFADFSPPNVSIAREFCNGTLILRSFGKAYGLAGVRLGFGLAWPQLASKLRDALGPWAVSGPALQVGLHAFRDAQWIEAMPARLRNEMMRLVDLLTEAGFEVVGSTALFVLARHPNALAVREKLGQAGIHVRVFADESSWIRFGLPGSEQTTQRLKLALQQCQD